MMRQEFGKAVMDKKCEGQEEDLETIQKISEEAAGRVAHTMRSDGDKAVKRTSESVRILEDAAARCTKVVIRKVLKKQGKPELII